MLKFTDYFHDEGVRREIYSVEEIENAEEFGFLGKLEKDLIGDEAGRQIAQIVNDSILGYLIKTKGERAVWEYLRTLDYWQIYSEEDSEPEVERSFPVGAMNQGAIEELPEVLDAIGALPIKDAVVQLKILSKRAWGTCGRFRRQASFVGFKEPFSYTDEDLALNRSTYGFCFRLPVSPEQLLLIGAQEASLISLFAYQRNLSSYVVLMFSEHSWDYLGYVELDKATRGILSIAFSERVAGCKNVPYLRLAIVDWARASDIPGLAFRSGAIWHDGIRLEFKRDFATNAIRGYWTGNPLERDIPDDLYYE